LLSQWMRRQRFDKKREDGRKLLPLKEAMLNCIDFDWDCQCKSWDERFEELETFKAKNPESRMVPQTQETKSLWKWVHSYQKSNLQNLEWRQTFPDRVKKLQSLDLDH